MPVLTRKDWLLLVLICAWGALRLAPGLAHASIHNWDESAHQAVARGLMFTPFTPHIYAAPLYSIPLSSWWEGGVWLHKPTLPFWLGALVLRVIGVTPLALRLVSLAGTLAAAGSIYLLARELAGRPLATLAALALPTLPFTFELVQGYLFGDVTDCSLQGFVALGAVALLWGIERVSWRACALAGLACGLGYLCKTALALAPLGVAAAMLVLQWMRLARGPGWRGFLAMLLTCAAVAAPWNLYTERRWPDVYAWEAAHTKDHIFGGASQPQWVRPADAILNEINGGELRPLPAALTLLAALWLAVRAVRRRETVPVMLTLWLAAAWGVLSYAHVKVPATAWAEAPAALAAVALLLADAWESPALALGAAAALAAPWALPHLPQLGQWRQALPLWLEQTRSRPGLFEGLVLAAMGLAVGGALHFGLRRWRRYFPVLGVPAALWVAWLALGSASEAQAELRVAKAPESLMSRMREPGLAAAAALPEASVIFLANDQDPSCCFEPQALMFWSGRMTYRRPVDVELARRAGLHPYLAAPAAEPLAEVPGVPANSALRLYDLLAPAAMAPLPAGITPVALELRAGTLLGYAHGPLDSTHDRWTFYLRPHGVPGQVQLGFLGRETHATQQLTPEQSANRSRRLLQGHDWFVMTTEGPRREDVDRLVLDGHAVPLTP